MAEKYATCRPRWGNTALLFRVIRETPQRLYVEPVGEVPRYETGGAIGYGDKMYLHRHQAIVLRSPESIDAFRAAWKMRSKKRGEAQQVHMTADRDAETEFEAAIENL